MCVSLAPLECHKVSPLISRRPIATYGRQGVAKAGVVKSEHAIAYASGTSPSRYGGEGAVAPERPMRRPVRIQPDEPGDILDPMSRINYARCYTVEHNVKVMPFGLVHKDSEKEFLYSFKNVFFHEDEQDYEDEEDSSSDDDQNAPGKGNYTVRRGSRRQQTAREDAPAIHSESSTATLRRPAPDASYQQGSMPPTGPDSNRPGSFAPNHRRGSEQSGYSTAQLRDESDQRDFERRQEEQRQQRAEQQRQIEEQQQLDAQRRPQRPRRGYSSSSRGRGKGDSSKQSKPQWPYK